MNANWFKNQDNVLIVSINDFIESYEKELKISNLRNQIERFRENPIPEGQILIGGNHTSIRLLSPSLTFAEHIDQGENVWVYMGKNSPCYCLDKTEPWRDKAYFFFSHRECEYYPCHQVKYSEQFNCLFCFCPLYCLGKKCGGNYNYFGDMKDCSKCMVPHLPDSYGYIMNKYSDIIAALSKMEGEELNQHSSNPDKRVI